MQRFVTEELFDEIHKFVENHLSSAPGCHDMDHTMRVYNNAITLYEMERSGNIEIIRLGALLHDIARPEEMNSKGKICHAALGAANAVTILTDFGITDQEFLTKISKVIHRHRYRGSHRPRSIEDKIVYDADKLDSIGAVGIGRAFHFAGRVGARLHNTREEALNSEEYSNNDSAYREYLVKLRDVPKRMLTESGRQLAEKRADFMHSFFERLNDEVYGY